MSQRLFGPKPIGTAQIVLYERGLVYRNLIILFQVDRHLLAEVGMPSFQGR
jgi:hypothetical protein